LVPNCDYQVDFVCGSPIDKFGPAGSNILYGAQNRLFSADNGGSQRYADSTLSGYVYLDSNNDGVKETNEAGISNVPLTLSGTDIFGHAVSSTVKTNYSGFYVFNSLKASDLAGYTITESKPSDYNDGKDTVGSLGGTVVVAGTMTTNQLNCDSNGVNYNFGERPLAQTPHGENFHKSYAALVAWASSLQPGEIQVAVDGLSDDHGANESAFINDAIRELNRQFASLQIHFSLVSGADAANAQLHLQVAATSGGHVILIDGWN
jgi:hypothetical protein